MAIARLLEVPGYGDDHYEYNVPPLSNPPPDHPLLNTKYDSLDDLVSDLYEWGA
jgi:hypothetical protein